MTVGHRLRVGSASRSLTVVFALSLLLALLPFTGASAQTADDEEFDGRFESTTELEADGNVDAAIEWSQFTFPDGSADTAAIGRSDLFPDNLASSLIQGQEDAPLLLTPSNSLAAEVEAELERLGVTTVHVLGEEAAIADSVVQELEAAGYTVHRDGGETRIETAIDIAATHAPNATSGLLVRAFGGPAGDETQAWADALAAGGWAADTGMPVFLTQTEELNDNLEDYLEDSNITSLTIIGGSQAISPAVEAELEAMGITVNRVSGANRFATAIAIAEARGFENAAEAGSIILVEGQAANAWASGFAAAAYADQSNGVIVLSNGENLPPETDAYLQGTDANDDGVNDDIGTQEHGDPHLVCGPFVNASACAEAAALLGYDELPDAAVNATFIDVPELQSVEFGSGDEDDDERVVIFTFDENIEENAVAGGQFVLYQYDMTPIFGGDTNADDNQVAVVFDYHEAELATVAAVRPGAVQDEDGNENIEGSAPLRNTSLNANRTQAPDLTGAEVDDTNFRVTYIFDEDVDTDSATLADYGIVVEDDAVAADGDDEAEVANPVSIFEIDDNEVTAQYTAADFDDEDDVIRAFVDEGAVEDEDGNTNAPQSVALSGTPEEDPRLLSANVQLSDDTDDDDDEDTVVFRFSESVDNAEGAYVPGNFFAVLADGTVVNADDIDESDSSDTRIEAEFPAGQLDESIARVGIRDGAVVADDDGDASEGIQTASVNPQSLSAGRTIGPDPLSMETVEDLDAFGNVSGYEVRFTFDEAIDDDDAAITEANIVGYEMDGDESSDLDFTGECAVDSDDDEVLVCDIDDEDDAEDVEVIALQYDAVRDYDGNPNYEKAFGFNLPGDDGDTTA